MNTSFFAWLAISAMLVGLFAPMPRHRSIAKSSSINEGGTFADSEDGDGTNSDDSSSDDSSDSSGD